MRSWRPSCESVFGPFGTSAFSIFATRLASEDAAVAAVDERVTTPVFGFKITGVQS